MRIFLGSTTPSEPPAGILLKMIVVVSGIGVVVAVVSAVLKRK